MNYLDKLSKIIMIPKDYRLVTERKEKRNGQKVEIVRFQKDGKFQLNGPRISVVFLNDDIISIKNLTTIPSGKFPDLLKARDISQHVFSVANSQYSKGLSFIRIEKQERTFIDYKNEVRTFPVLWIKYGHKIGSYNWVTLGANGIIIEMEFDSRWDYFKGRRKTEMWDNDDWILAHEGKGPQLPIPNALA